MSDRWSGCVSLRPVCPEDDEFLFSVYASTHWEALGLGDWESDGAQELLRMQYRLQQTHYQRYYADAEVSIVMLDGEAIGRLDTQRGPDELRLIDIALLPTHRGSGVGHKLIQDLLEQARVEGKAVRLQVQRGNPAARLYARLGFKRTGGSNESTQSTESEIYCEMEWLPEPGGPRAP
jgi:ribosomal protein S18 acetylase RimI-like enzyme